MRIGSDKLGLKVQWRYHFVGAGTVLEPTFDAVALDAGGALVPGIVDQHQGGVTVSTAELVFGHPELVYGHLMNGWLQRARSGAVVEGCIWSPCLVTHRQPDFDALVACYLARKLIETGSFPHGAQELAEYAGRVDMGRYKVDLADEKSATHPPHMAWLAVQHLPHASDGDRLLRGFRLLDASLAQFNRRSPGGPAIERASEWREDVRFEEVKALLDADYAGHGAFLSAGRTQSMTLPASDGGRPLVVSGFFGSAAHRSKLNKYWVRAAGHPFFVTSVPRQPVPEGQPLDTSGGTPACYIISIDETWSDPQTGRKPTLLGLGRALERLETQERVRAGKPKRGGLPRYPDGSCDNDDPWYDGRGHAYTIVDSPRSGTYLSEATVCDAVGSPFWHVRLLGSTVFVVRPSKRGVAESAKQSIARFASQSSVLDSWFDACEEYASTPTETSYPDGFALRSCRVRRFPGGLVEPVEILELSTAEPSIDGRGAERATLESLVEWVGEADKRADGRLLLLADLALHDSPGDHSQVEEALHRLGRGKLRVGSTSNIVLFNRRAVAVRGVAGSATERAERNERLKELLLLAAFQSEALLGFRGKLASLFARTTRRIVGGRALQRDFTNFVSLYLHADVTRDDQALEVFTGMREELSIQSSYELIANELDRIASLEQQDVERSPNLILFLVGLGGIVEAVFAIDEPGEVSVARWAVLSSLVLGVALSYFFLSAGYRRRQLKTIAIKKEAPVG